MTRERGAAAARLADAVDELITAEKDSADMLRQHGARVIEREADLAALHGSEAAVGRGMVR